MSDPGRGGDAAAESGSDPPAAEAAAPELACAAAGAPLAEPVAVPPRAPGLAGRVDALLDRLGKIRRALPWLWLALGVTSALMMDRSPGRAVLVAVGGVAGWGLLAVLLLLTRRTAGGPTGTILRVAHFSSLAAAQWLTQLSLFFALPFYFKAAAVPAHHAFVGVVAAAALLTLWDPLSRALLQRPLPALLLQGIASFAGLNAVLPVLGVGNRVSLFAAAAGAALGAPAAALLAPRESRRRVLLAGAAVVLVIAGAVGLGAARAIPAAPLALIEGALGTELSGMGVANPQTRPAGVPAQLVCATAIAAPRGLSDALFHVWSKDGVVVDRIPLVVKGGREQGFRTWSIKRQLGTEPRGRWSCAVETASGQHLGARSLVIDSGAEAPRAAPTSAASP